MTIFDKIRPHSCFAQSDAKRGTQIKNASNGGYILVYVMVVVLTLCILAASICTSAVHNLKTQQHSIEHMKFVYEAEGIGERFVAELQEAVLNPTNTSFVPSTAENAATQNENALQLIFKNAIEIAAENALADPTLIRDTIVVESDAEGNPKIICNKKSSGLYSITMNVQIQAGDSKLDTEIQWMASVVMREEKDEPDILKGYRYSVDDIDPPVYLSYEIKAVNQEGGAE